MAVSACHRRHRPETSPSPNGPWATKERERAKKKHRPLDRAFLRLTGRSAGRPACNSIGSRTSNTHFQLWTPCRQCNRRQRNPGSQGSSPRFRWCPAHAQQRRRGSAAAAAPPYTTQRCDVASSGIPRARPRVPDARRHGPSKTFQLGHLLICSAVGHAR